MRKPRRQNLLHVFRRKLAHQPDGFNGFRWRCRLKRFEKPLRGILSEVADNRGQQFAVLAESAMPEPVGHVVDRGLGHQVEDLHHSVSDVAAAHCFFDEFRQPLLRADAWPQALRRSRPLRLHTL